MDANANILIANNWFEAFNEYDLEKLLALYTENAEHYSPKLKLRKPETLGLIKGKTALRAWWKDSFDRLPSLKYEPVQFTANAERVFMEYIRKVKGEEDLMVGEVLEVKAGRIVASRVYHG
jgi:limonene-1,2-epoxide hydrolase